MFENEIVTCSRFESVTWNSEDDYFQVFLKCFYFETLFNYKQKTIIPKTSSEFVLKSVNKNLLISNQNNYLLTNE